MNLTLDLDAACAARKLIEEAFDYAKYRLEQCIRNRNAKEYEYCYDQYMHWMEQSNWIDGIIEEL